MTVSFGGQVTVTFTDGFKKELRKLPPTLLAEAKLAIADLYKQPIPMSRRLHSLGGYKKPKVFTIDVTGNKSHKISLEIDGMNYTLRRVATHKEIDCRA